MSPVFSGRFLLFRVGFGLVVLGILGWLSVGPVSFAPPVSLASDGPAYAGDTDCDADVDELDALGDLSDLAGLEAPGCIAQGNVNCDNVLDARDVTSILRHVADLVSDLPIGCPLVGSLIGEESPANPLVEFYEADVTPSVVASSSDEVHAAQVTPVAGVPLPGEVSPGDDITFSLTFQNSGTAEGYGPFIDLLLPIGGPDEETQGGPCDGLSFVSAVALFSSPANVPLVIYPAGGHDVYPYSNGSTHCATVGGTAAPAHPLGAPDPTLPGYERVVLELPFGSVYPVSGAAGQPPVLVTVTAHVSDYVDIGVSLDVYARGGFRYGSDPGGNVAPAPIVGPMTQNSTIVKPFEISKGCTLPSGVPCPESESATGPNFPMHYVITVDIDDGVVIDNLHIEDILPDNVQFLSVLSVIPAFSGTDPAVVFTPLMSTPGPGGTLTVDYTTQFTGITGPDVIITFDFYIPDLDANGLPVLGADCSPGIALNDIKASGDFTSIDPRDWGSPNAAIPFVSDDFPFDNKVIGKCLAIQKGASPSPGPVIPGTTITYTLGFQMSDYLQMDQLEIVDKLSDGQTLDPTSLTLQLSDKTGSIATTPIPSGFFTLTGCNPPTEVAATLTIDLSGAIAALYSGPPATLNAGVWTGGLIPTVPPKSPGAKGVITFKAEIDDQFACTVPGDQSVDKWDTVTDAVKITGHQIQRADGVQIPAPPDDMAIDGSSAAVGIAGDTIFKCIYSIDRLVGVDIPAPQAPKLCAVNPDPLIDPPPPISPGDKVTFRILKTIPSGDWEDLKITDFLPHPALQPGGFTYGPGATNSCPPQSGPGLPVPTTPGNNTIQFDFGSGNDPNNQPCTIDILLTVTVTNDPFADGLKFTNEASECEEDSFNGPVCQQAIAPMELTEPRLRITKGVVSACQPKPAPAQGCTDTGSFSLSPVGPNGVTFKKPGQAPPAFTGMITSPGLQMHPINANATIDAGDLVKFVIVVENYGSGVNGAFDITINDTLPPGLVIPVGSPGANLTVTDGAGGTFTCVGGCSITDLFSPGGIELVDPGPVNPGPGGLEPHNNVGTNIAVITYDLQVPTTAVIGECFTNTASIVNYAGLEGGANHVGTVYGGPYTDDATICLTPSIAKSIVSTSEAHTLITPNNQWAGGTEDMAIGETIRYRLVVGVPEGQSLGITVTDHLPAGMSYVPATLSGPVPAGFTNAPTAQVALQPGGPFDCTNPGADPVFYIDDPTMPGKFINTDQDATPETETIEFSAVVCNVAGNQDGVILPNNATVSVDQSSVTSNTVYVKVVEPHVSIVKSVQFGSQQGMFDYTITLHSDGTATAFDVSMFDTVPPNCTIEPSSPFENMSSGVVGYASSVVGNIISVTIDEFPVNENTFFGFTTRCTDCPNDASVIWTSLPGPMGTLNNPAHADTPGASGAVDGERDGTLLPSVNDYRETDKVTSSDCVPTVPDCGITVIKDTIPASPQGFSFTVPGATIPSFTLEDNGSGSSTFPDTQTFTSLTCGSYTIEEFPPPGWTVSIYCSGISPSSVTVSGQAVTVVLANSEHVVCTFTNEETTVVDIGGKHFTANTGPGSPTGKYSFDVTNIGPNPVVITIHDQLPSGVTLQNVPPIPVGNSTSWNCAASMAPDIVDCVSPSIPTNGVAILEFDVDTTGNPPLQNCGHILSDILMDPQSMPPTHDYTACDTPANTPCSLTIIKDTIPDGPQQWSFSITGSITDTFTLQDPAGTFPSSKVYGAGSGACGMYTITETGLPAGWQVNIHCSGASGTGYGVNSVTLSTAPGQNVTCTFKNHQ